MGIFRYNGTCEKQRTQCPCYISSYTVILFTVRIAFNINESINFHERK